MLEQIISRRVNLIHHFQVISKLTSILFANQQNNPIHLFDSIGPSHIHLFHTSQNIHYSPNQEQIQPGQFMIQTPLSSLRYNHWLITSNIHSLLICCNQILQLYMPRKLQFISRTSNILIFPQNRKLR